MGGFSSILGAVAPMLTGSIPGVVLGAVNQMAAQRQASDALKSQQNLYMQQLIERQNQSNAQLANRTALDKQALDANAAADATRRATALKRAVARQKTLFSAQGLGADSGSAEAVLLGLYDDSQFAQGEDDRLNTMRKLALDQDLTNQQQRNLLEATQLAQQNNLARILKGY